MKRIGLLGGSFNPAHAGHRHISLAAMRALGLDEVWWLVSPGNPLKEESAMAPFAARLASARNAARGTRIRVSDFETRAGTRFTVDTVAALRRWHPDKSFVWLMGEDILPQFHRWRQWRRLAQLVPIAVLSRPGYDGLARAARAMGWLRRFVRPPSQKRSWTGWSAPAILLLRLPPHPASASAIRALDPDWHRQPPSASSRPQRIAAPLPARRPLVRSSR